MTEVQILDIMYEAFQLAMKLSLPFLLISMIVGVVIAVFQAATQINEQTMTFVPKLLAIMVLLGFLGSSMLVMLQEFFQYIVELIAKGVKRRSMFITFSMAVMRMSGAIGFNPLFGKSNFPVKIRAYFVLPWPCSCICVQTRPRWHIRSQWQNTS